MKKNQIIISVVVIVVIALGVYFHKKRKKAAAEKAAAAAAKSAAAEKSADSTDAEITAEEVALSGGTPGSGDEEIRFPLPIEQSDSTNVSVLEPVKGFVA